MQDTQDLAYAGWRRAPEPFWAEAAEAVSWYRRWNRVLDASRAPFYRWFSGGTVNTCYNALDRHVAAGRADQLHRPPAPASASLDDFGPRPRLVRAHGGSAARGVRAGGCDRSPLHPLHVGDDGHAEGGGARQRRAPGRAHLEHEERLRSRVRRSLLGPRGPGLGRGPLLQRLPPSDPP